MRANLINIAFYLEPQVDEFIKSWVQREKDKYEAEHKDNDVFYEVYIEQETVKFDELYQQWKNSVVRFQFLKQENAIERFLDKMES
jgi:hypothetical protein